MLVLRNIAMFFRKNTLIFLLLIITQVLSVVVILFSYGVYVNNQYTLQEKEDAMVRFYALLVPEDSNSGDAKSLKEHLPEIVEEIKDILVFGSVFCEVEVTQPLQNGDIYGAGTIVCSYFVLQSGVYQKPADYITNLEPHRKINFTEQQLNSGEKICLLSGVIGKPLIGEELISLNGEDFLVIGVSDDNDPLPGLAEIPILSLGDTMKPQMLFLSFSRPITYHEYEVTCNAIQTYYPDARIDKFEEYDVDEVSSLKTMMLACVFLSVLSATTISAIYLYILRKRLRMTAIYRICGSTTFQSINVYLSELALLLALTTCVGGVLFMHIIEPRLENVFTWFSRIFRMGVCIKLMAVYLLVVWGITSAVILWSVRLTPKEMLRRCNE